MQLYLLLAGGVTQVEMGLQPAGDVNNDNVANISDFAILKNAFGGTIDLRADFNNDGVINAGDFSLLKGNFGTAGPNLICP